MTGAVDERAWWLGLLLGAVPLLALAVWYCADACYRAAFALSQGSRGHEGNSRRRLPPGHMGLPFLGENLSLLWYFKLARRPDGFVDTKKSVYGEVGVYRTHLFGSPTAVVYCLAANKFVLQSPNCFGICWPEPELVGPTCVINVEDVELSHQRLHEQLHALQWRCIHGQIHGL